MNTTSSSSSRRVFLGTMLAAGAASAPALRAAPATGGLPATRMAAREIKLGLIGCGSRGLNVIAKLFQAHGGFTFHSVADYFEPVAVQAGGQLGVDRSRCFAGLSGYRRLLDSGVEAVAILDVPCFYPEQARAAVDAGVHVYLAKPVAVDVPGTLLIGECGRRATQRQRCFLVDYQIPGDPAIGEVADRVRAGALGRIAHITSFGFGWRAWPDPPRGPTIADRLRRSIWLSDTALGGDTIVSYDIHIIDGVIAVTGQRPSAACGRSRTCRPQPQGDRTDVAAVIYEQDDGVLWTHVTQALNNNFDLANLSASILGTQATAHLGYKGKAYVRGGERHYVGEISPALGREGPARNIAEFYRSITEGRFENPTVQRAVDGHLTAILGREAAARRCYLTMEELLRENRRLPVDVSGLKV
jgi:predicted dehydrogenase